MGNPIIITLIFQGIAFLLFAACTAFALYYGVKFLSKKDVDEARENTTFKWKEYIFKTNSKGVILLAVACIFLFGTIKARPVYKETGDEKVVGKFETSAVELMINAAGKGLTKVVGYLLSQGVYINAVNEKGESALFVAASEGHTGTAQFLIDNGSDTATTTIDNRTALSVAKEKGFPDIVIILEGAGAKE
jgi:hypothetical protein